MQRVFDLSQKEVINLNDGVCLGRICDVEIDEASGRVISVVLPGKSRAMGLLGRNAELIIPWELISRIGNDVILVRLGALQGKKSTF